MASSYQLHTFLNIALGYACNLLFIGCDFARWG